MKRLLIALSIVLVTVTLAASAQLKPFPFLFTGRWQPAENPLLIDENGFQDIQNLRKDGKRLKGVSGHTKINSTALSSYQYARNGFHFRKEQPAESHVLIYTYDSTTPTAAKVLQNTTAIPSAGDFSATAVYTDSSVSSGTIGRFSAWPQGSIGYADGEVSKVWGGNEYPITSFVTSTAAVTGSTLTNPRDYSTKITNTSQDADQLANVGSGGGIDSDTKLMLHFDGADGGTTFTDSSSGTKTMTAVGNAVTDTDRKKFGTAGGLFDGTGDDLTTPDHADFDLSTVDFTLDLWVYLSEVRSHTVLSHATDYVGGSEDYYTFRIRNDGGTLRPDFLEVVNGATNDQLTSTGSISLNTWTHIAWVRSSGTMTIYINGTAAGSGAVGDIADHTQLVHIGDTDSAAYFYGSMDELRFSLGKARWITNFTPSATAYNTSASHWLVGTTRPLQGVKFYVKNANTEASTLSASYWDGSTWTSLTITDNTSGVDTTGTVTWSSTVDTARPKYINGLSLYWYQFTMTAGEADLYYVTADAPFQDVQNIWSGEEIPTASVKLYEDSTYKEYTDEVAELDTYVMVLDALVAGTEYLLLGFTEPIQGINVLFYPGRENTDATVLSVYYWNGTAWVSVGGMADGTAEPAGDSLGKSGTISWQKIDEGQQFERSFSDEFPLYYYKLVWSAALDAEVEIDYITGIPFPDSVRAYKFPGMYQNRAWLFSETEGEKNKAIYSSYNTSDIWNGSDSGHLYFGDETELTAWASIYNVFQTTGYYQLLVTKKNETYRLFGNGPENWEIQQMSGTVGCIAPLSMATCDISEITKDSRRNVAVWQSQNGVVMCDGATIIPISDDIKCYWDPTDSRYIPTSRQDDSVGWYDPNLKAYKLLISSGSGQATHNVELEYSLENGEWTKLYRVAGTSANPLQTGFTVQDTGGVLYSYGVTDLGYTYRLENGNTFDSTAIAEYVWTKDLLLDNEMPFFLRSTIEYFRLAFKNKSTASTEDIDIAHYCNGTLTVDGTANQDVPTDIDIDQSDGYATQSCTLGPCFKHSFKFTLNASTVSNGMELTGMGLMYETEKTISSK